MSTFEVQMPDHLADFVASRAKTSGFANSSEFIVSIVSKLKDRQSEVESLLIEGLESGPAMPWDSVELEDIKKRISDRGNKS
jgi:Arc/MetJ-type ribon-helix-helix transcriptional regulator